MKSWGLSFITEDNFKKHVAATIEKYGEKLESFDIKRFNKNIVDPIKLIFDKIVYQLYLLNWLFVQFGSNYFLLLLIL